MSGTMYDQDYIKQQIESNQPFFIGRIAGVELQVAYQIQNQSLSPNLIHELENNAGIKVTSNSLRLYTDMLIASYDNCTAIAEWDGKVFEITGKGQELISKRTPHIYKMLARNLEPYYYENSWMSAMKGKRVLIVHPFITTIKSQIEQLSNLFPFPWFENCTFVFAKPPLTLAGNHQGKDWKEHYDEFITELPEDYDIALVAAGGYGMLIADYIFKAKKQVMYIGGALQLFFGIIGKRWFDNKEILALMNDSWVRSKERPDNFKKVENGCYW